MVAIRKQLRVTGLVQGVGFRPFVYRLARKLLLTGHACNTGAGVVIEVQGLADRVASFAERLQAEAPAQSRIESLSCASVPVQAEERFTILESEPGEAGLVSADMATCRRCTEEIQNSVDRRYEYAFTSCTECGPRYSILRRLPYDRPQTTMDAFPLCEQCRAEYDLPESRRFHAQTNACPVCGPRLWLAIPGDATASGVPSEMVLDHAARMISEGKIVACKGLGGYQLICDARSSVAVQELRRRKHRSGKPLAVMVRNLRTARQLCEISAKEEIVLAGAEKPIVLLRHLATSGVAPEVAPGIHTLGLMLPYTPLHELLFHHLERQGVDDAVLVATSGNISDEPILIENLEAEQKLRSVADAYVHHNRPIHTRVDDSVVRVFEDQPILLRRSRGYCPAPIAIDAAGLEVLGCGAQQKSTFCLARGRHAFLSQHLGDLQSHETLQAYRETLSHMQMLLDIKPSVIAHDLHPDYLSTRVANELPAVFRIGIQHHHAHIASCMAEHRLREPVIGVAWDGSGYGTDRTIWGGEFLIADRLRYNRVAHFQSIPLAGGERAIREPWRVARSYAHSLGDDRMLQRIELFQRVPAGTVAVVDEMLRKKIQTIEASSCGRLFDAVGALLLLQPAVSYEGEAAVMLENIASEQDGYYDFEVQDGTPAQIDVRPMIREIVSEAGAAVPVATISSRFHNTLAAIAADVCNSIRKQSGISRVCLSGGCFQNTLLLRRTIRSLHLQGFEVYFQQRIPANDGGISLGQVAIACERLRQKLL